MTTALDNWPAYVRLLAVASAGQLPTAPTPLGGTQPPLPVIHRQKPGVMEDRDTVSRVVHHRLEASSVVSHRRPKVRDNAVQPFPAGGIAARIR
jgi:hypothetical protein